MLENINVHSIMFNPSKSKLLCYNMLTSVVPNVMLCGEVIDVHFEKHLGNRLYDDIYKHDMKTLIGDFYLRSNSVIVNFNMCDSVTLNNIHSIYCSSLYGIELYNFNSSYVTDVYIAWRKIIRRIFVAHLDAKEAFDKINRTLIFFKLRKLRVSGLLYSMGMFKLTIYSQISLLLRPV